MRYATLVSGDVHIALWLHSSAEPPPDLFDAACIAIEEHKRANPGVLSKLRMLVITDGGGPNGRQRAQLNAGALDGLGIKTVAFSNKLNSPLLRKVAQALAWTQPAFKAYAPHQWQEGLSYLDIADVGVFEQAAQFAAELSRPLETLKEIQKNLPAAKT